MKNARYIGIMSGTSMDAIDCVICEFDDDGCHIIAAHSFTYPKAIKQQIRAIFADNNRLSLSQFGQLDQELAARYGDCVNTLLEQQNIKAEDIAAIGCHGQTIYHAPNETRPFSIQLGNGHRLAAMTGIATITDFRMSDMCHGGQGAPLVPAFHQAFFADRHKRRIICNIGGIANISILDPNGSYSGFDTGPGNTLVDQWINLHQQKPFDENGRWAEGGKIIKPLLSDMLDDPYFKRLPPKSTGLDYFNQSWLRVFLTQNHDLQDVQATLLELTAISIASAINAASTSRDEIYLCGGGTNNNRLIERLSHHLECQNINPSTQLGIDTQWVEASCFAWLAKNHISAKPTAFMKVTGANKNTIAGVLYRP
ncbi:MAG: anhydro-N-acetylmuramic acid kinase [Francisellaceae bacterium]